MNQQIVCPACKVELRKQGIEIKERIEVVTNFICAEMILSKANEELKRLEKEFDSL